MRYVSTRGRAPELGFADVLLAGLASDGGLYVPSHWPRLADRHRPAATVGSGSYVDRAVEVYLDPDDPSASMVVIRDPHDSN